MQETREIHVLHRNDQWMVQRDRGDVFLVEILEDHPSDLEGGFWIRASELATASDDGHTELLHIAEKNWVDMDLLESAARQAIALSGTKPNYDLDKGFAEARRYREGIYGRQ
jgi:hypothetical protein